MSKPHNNLAYKVLIIGDSGVGKTSLLMRHITSKFATHDSTMAVGFKLKTYKLNNKTVTLQLWDTAGQEKFRAITRQYYRGAHAAFIVFDLGNRSSFRNLSVWMDEISRNTNGDITTILIANKCDLPESKQEVTQAEIADFITRHRLDKYFITSAKEGKHVEQMFRNLAELLKLRHNELDTLSLTSNSNSSNDLASIRPSAKIQMTGGDSGCCNG